MTAPSLTIRPFAPADYPAIVTIWNRVLVHEPHTVEQIAHDDGLVREPRLFGRLVALDDGRLLGVGEFEQPLGMYHPQKFLLRIYVQPEAQGSGIGSALYAALEAELARHDPISFRTDLSEDHPYAEAFAAQRGFVVDKRDWQLTLDLETFEPAAHQGPLDRVAESGLTIASITERGNDAEVHRQFFDLFTEVRQDVPRTEPATPLTWDDFRQNVLDGPDFLPAATYLAFDGDDCIGMTMSWTAGDPPELHTGLTAVLPSHRGRGVATALKVAALTKAKAEGRSRAVTDNDINNVEMLAVNAKLGYVKAPAILSMVRHL